MNDTVRVAGPIIAQTAWFAYLIVLTFLFAKFLLAELLNLGQQGRYLAIIKTSVRGILFSPLFLAIYLVATHQVVGHPRWWKLYTACLSGYVLWIFLSKQKPNIKAQLGQEARLSPTVFWTAIAVLIPAMVALLLCSF